MGIARPRTRRSFAERFRDAEHLLYVAVGVTLALAGRHRLGSPDSDGASL